MRPIARHELQMTPKKYKKQGGKKPQTNHKTTKARKMKARAFSFNNRFAQFWLDFPQFQAISLAADHSWHHVSH